MRLPAIVITHNEAVRLPACLASAVFADETVAVDERSRAIGRVAGDGLGP